MDTGNPFSGQWQLLEWIDTTGLIKATNQSQIYYSFQLGLVPFQQVRGQSVYSLHARYEGMSNQLHISQPFRYAGNGHDEILPMSVLAEFAVPTDGILEIVECTSSRMCLKSDEMGTLILRKY